MKQRTRAMTTGFERYSKKTRRAAFLEEMEQVVPWAEWCALIDPYYPKAGKGRPPVGVERMLRIYFLQQWFNLSDPGVEEGRYDSVVMRQFAGIDLGQEPVPDETTVCKFGHRLEEHEIGGEILQRVNLYLQSRGVKITTGTIVDATVIHAPSSTKNREQQRDPEMHQVRKRQTLVLRDESARGSGQQDEDDSLGGSDRGQRGRQPSVAGVAAWGRNQGMGRSSLSGADGSYSGGCTRCAGPDP